MLLVRIIISLRKLGIQISGQRVEPYIVGCVTKLRGKFDLVGILRTPSDLFLASP